MEPSGRNQWQPVAKARAPKIAQTSRSATGGQPTATVPERLVRRGSTVRVRQRACKTPAIGGFVPLAVAQPGDKGRTGSHAAPCARDPLSSEEGVRLGAQSNEWLYTQQLGPCSEIESH
jgi:hypothetical protein